MFDLVRIECPVCVKVTGSTSASWLARAAAKVFEARCEAEEMLVELAYDQGRISDNDYDTLQQFVDACESTEDTVR